jgi:hypothetical protein
MSHLIPANADATMTMPASKFADAATLALKTLPDPLRDNVELSTSYQQTASAPFSVTNLRQTAPAQ